ncbi:MAG: glutaminyl-peptide cyclotransferase [Parachlamydiaceae bacterium]|nr:glutaminyl-peptide cyclotransferase [Parachlamydiaceae bacterium]
MKRKLIFCLLVLYPCFYAESVLIQKVKVLSKFPHDVKSFTQGLAFEGKKLYETTGLYGSSSVRQIDLHSGKTIQSQFLPKDVFGEGIAVFANKIIVITWKNQTAFVFNRLTFQLVNMIHYLDDGWGLCRDGSSIWMSNGTSTLTQRDPETFKVLKSIQVTFNDQPVNHLNDLECVGDSLYANVWKTDWIVRIDKHSGQVMSKIDASILKIETQKKKFSLDEVLNGIAYNPETKSFYLTGKNWPYLFEVLFIDE